MLGPLSARDVRVGTGSPALDPQVTGVPGAHSSLLLEAPEQHSETACIDGSRHGGACNGVEWVDAYHRAREACRAGLARVASVSLVALAVAACGSSSAPKVGACIDAKKHVVDCSSAAATQKLVSDLSAPNAIACVQIGAP